MFLEILGDHLNRLRRNYIKGRSETAGNKEVDFTKGIFIVYFLFSMVYIFINPLKK